MTPFRDQEELQALLDALCEERITPEEIARLEALVLANPEAEAFYVQYVGMYADLTQSLSSSSGLTERALRQRVSSPTPVVTPSTPAAARRRWTFKKVAGLAGCLALLLSVGLRWAAPWGPPVWHPNMVLRVNDQPPAEPANEAFTDDNGETLDDTVAVVRADSLAEWEGVPLQVGATLPPGRLRLLKGFAEIEFYSGATVVLEAPTDFEIVSSMEAYCWNGKLRASVPSQAQGFTISSPRLDLVDRGTEFGVLVNGLDSTEVHVFDGKVELYKAGNAHKTAPDREVTAGQAVRVDLPEVASDIRNKSDDFLSSDELLARMQVEGRRRHRQWESQREARHRDPSLAVYYSFQPDDEWNRKLDNEALNSAPGTDGTVVGCQWMDGRWPGKLALDFRQVSDRVRLTIPGKFDSLTMALWARIDALPNRFQSLLMSDSWDDFEGHWHIDSKGTVELGVQGEGRKNWVHYHAMNKFRPELLGRWTHLAIVYDRTAGEVTQYINGVSVSRLPITLDKPLQFGDCELGNWNPTTRPHHHPIRFLTGRIDEFLMYGKALSAQEIRDLVIEGQAP